MGKACYQINLQESAMHHGKGTNLLGFTKFI
jgi:hypothetical protein